MVFEQIHVENIVKTSTCGQLKTIRDVADALEDAKRPGITRTELAIGARREGLGRAVQQPQPDPVTHLELNVAMADIIVFLGQLLSLQKTSLRETHSLPSVYSFAECRPLFAECRVTWHLAKPSTRQREALPSATGCAALGEEQHSAKSLFAECNTRRRVTLGKEWRSAKQRDT